MGFRPDLDLTAILDLHERVLPSPEEAEALRRVQEPDDSLRYDTPVRLGWGPDRWSTSTALVPVEPVCYDVNGYYRELGVDWRASRKELREAYVAKNGQESPRLTYIFKQLLDPVVREAYDKTPQGEVFLDDYTEADLSRRAHEEAGKRALLGLEDSVEDVLADWGYVVLDREEVDNVRAVRQDRPQRTRRSEWNYSYYAWKTEDFVQDEARLQEWQKLLSKAAAQAGRSPDVSIGLTSLTLLSDHRFIIETVGGKPVIFFSTEDEPAMEVAEHALSEILEST